MVWVLMLMVVRMMTPRPVSARAGGGELKTIVRADLGDLARVCGGMEAAWILARIMDWTTSNEKRSSMRHYKEGAWWMYYSYAEWSEREVVWLSDRQVERRIRHLEHMGLIVGKQFAMGAPKWYRPDMAVISAKVKALSPANLVHIKTETPYQNRGTPHQNGETPSRKVWTPIVKSNTSNPIDSSKESTRVRDRGDKAFSSASDLQTDFSLMAKEDQELTDLRTRYGQGFDDCLTEAKRRGARKPINYAAKIARQRGLSNPLMRRFTPPASPLPAGVDTQQSQGVKTTPPRPQGGELLTGEAGEWRKALGQLELQLDVHNFDTWVRGVEFVGRAGDVWTLRARDSYARDMLEHRLGRNVRRVLSDVVGRDVQVRFESEVRDVRAM